MPASSSTFKRTGQSKVLISHLFSFFSDFLGCEKLFSPPESLFCKMQMQNKMYFGVLKSPSEPGWQHFLVLRSNLHYDLSKIQVGTNWLSRRHPHIGFNFKNVMMLSPSLSLLSYFFFGLVVVSIPYFDLLCCSKVL